MPSYTVILKKIVTTKYQTEAKDRGDALNKALDGRAEEITNGYDAVLHDYDIKLEED